MAHKKLLISSYLVSAQKSLANTGWEHVQGMVTYAGFFINKVLENDELKSNKSWVYYTLLPQIVTISQWCSWHALKRKMQLLFKVIYCVEASSILKASSIINLVNVNPCFLLVLIDDLYIMVDTKIHVYKIKYYRNYFFYFCKLNYTLITKGIVLIW